MSKILKITVVQRRPNTCVAVVSEDGRQYVGFSKVCWPDTWAPKMGVALALGKAMAAMLKIGPPENGMIETRVVEDPCSGLQLTMLPQEALDETFLPSG